MMTTATTTKLVTADELLGMPDPPSGGRYELVRGRLIEVSPPSTRSNEVAGELIRRLGNHIREYKRGRFGGSEGGFLLSSNPDTVRAPDVWLVRAERVSSGRMPDRFFAGAPDLVVEVLSPTDRTGDIWQRVGQYLDAGSHLVWVIDPNTEAAAAFPADGFPIIIGSDGTLDGGDVVPGFVLPLRELFDA
jgi:Uma2 family endonuclease